MNKLSSKMRTTIVILGTLSLQWVVPSAFADDQIRLNPNYKAPIAQESPLKSDEIIAQIFQDDFDRFLKPRTEAEQYILLTEPNEGERAVISLSSDTGKSGSILTVDHNFEYNPSLSFNLPTSSLALGDSTNTGLSSGNLAGSQLIVSLAPKGSANNPFISHNAFKLYVGSSVMRTPVNRHSAFLNRGNIAQQAYNLSLGVGYSGFQLGASYSRNDFLFASDLTGFDLGIGYMADSWSAKVRVGEYSRGSSILLSQDYNIFDNISAYELGAAYRLFSNVSLTGRFTYYSYGFGSDVESLDDVQSLIFGTNLSF